MQDYRLPRKSSHRPQPRVKKTPRNRKPSSPMALNFLKWPLRLLMVIACLAVLGFVLLRFVAPHFLPLTENRNIVFVSSKKDLTENKIVVAQYRPNSQSLTLITLQNDQPVSVIGGFGEYPLRSVYPLLDLENKDGIFARGAFSFVTGHVVDGVVALPHSQLPTTQAEVIQALQVYPGSGIETSLAKVQALRFLFFTLQLPSEKLTHQTNSSLAEWETYREKLAVKYPEDECSVAVVNTTPKGGLAREIGALIEHTGYTVIRITDTTDNQLQTKVMYDPDHLNCQQQAQRLSDLFPSVITVESNHEMTSTYRAKIVISLGQDVSQLR